MSPGVNFREFHLSETKTRRIRGEKPLILCELAIIVKKKIARTKIHIDDNPNFAEHIRKLCTKASQEGGVLPRLRNLIPCKVKLLL